MNHMRRTRIRVGSDSRHATVQIPPLRAQEDTIIQTDEISIFGKFQNSRVCMVGNCLKHIIGCSVVFACLAKVDTEEQAAIISVRWYLVLEFRQANNLVASK